LASKLHIYVTKMCNFNVDFFEKHHVGRGYGAPRQTTPLICLIVVPPVRFS